MILIAAVDNRNGMMFNGRRQSQDLAMREKVIRMSTKKPLWMSPYSAKLFAGCMRVREDNQFLDKAEEGEYCFVEDADAAPYEWKIEQIILFRWNRNYPGDQFFDINLKGGRWKLEKAEDFPGRSHEKISMEVYRK